ncbi:hypothetical protein [Marinagarivorans algicola]|uniref:hypothetical protein n=1 Tax=Marinagarivorans algicola TaxID=1513270 RepID=UPI0006B5CBA6|nr:hypothetical protein [Marinagarivorans algicola]
MRITQISKQLGKSLEHELAHLFIVLGDSQLPEEAHTPGHVNSIRQGINTQGLGGEYNANVTDMDSATHLNTAPSTTSKIKQSIAH